MDAPQVTQIFWGKTIFLRICPIRNQSLAVLRFVKALQIFFPDLIFLSLTKYRCESLRLACFLIILEASKLNSFPLRRGQTFSRARVQKARHLLSASDTSGQEPDLHLSNAKAPEDTNLAQQLTRAPNGA